MVKPVQSQSNAGAIAQGCVTFALFGLMIYGYRSCTRIPDKTTEQTTAEKAVTINNRTKGFHCLSGLDGSNMSLVDAVKRGLREPSSFEHIETRIMPVDSKGFHHTTMEYRAHNGFGGTAVGLASAEVEQATCIAKLINIEP